MTAWQKAKGHHGRSIGDHVASSVVRAALPGLGAVAAIWTLQKQALADDTNRTRVVIGFGAGLEVPLADAGLNFAPSVRGSFYSAKYAIPVEFRVGVRYGSAFVTSFEYAHASYTMERPWIHEEPPRSAALNDARLAVAYLPQLAPLFRLYASLAVGFRAAGFSGTTGAHEIATPSAEYDFTARGGVVSGTLGVRLSRPDDDGLTGPYLLPAVSFGMAMLRGSDEATTLHVVPYPLPFIAAGVEVGLEFPTAGPSAPRTAAHARSAEF